MRKTNNDAASSRSVKTEHRRGGPPFRFPPPLGGGTGQTGTPLRGPVNETEKANSSFTRA